MTKALLAKKAANVLKDEKARRQLVNIFIMLFSAVILPAVLFSGFLDSAVSSFSYGGINEEVYSTLSEKLDQSELDQDRKDACMFIFLTYFSDYAGESETIPEDIISSAEENESGETILLTLSEKYSFYFEEADIEILNSILGGSIWSP